MKILVTGGSGFLGSHVADVLSLAGHEITIFDTKPSSWLRHDQGFIAGSVTDRSAVESAVAQSDAVYHFAAIADINDALTRPRDTVEVNVLGTLNVLEAMRIHKVKRFVFASSIYVYSDQGGFYRTSKQASEHLIHDYHEQFGLEFTVLRFGSLYGPRADRSNGLHRILTQALEEGSIEYHGTGEEVREYIHVLDAAAMSADVLVPEYANCFVHLTGRERMTSRDLLYMIREILGGNLEIGFSGDRAHGHYVQTPYNYTPKLGRRMMRSTYIDLGLGLLDCLQHLDQNRSTEDVVHIADI